MSDNTRTSYATDDRDRPIAARVPAETDADRLIDEVFQDVDRMLDCVERLPHEPADPKPIALKPLQVPPIVIEPLVAPAAAPKPEPVESASVTVEPSGKTQRREDKTLLWFDRLLLGGAFVSLAVVLGLWLFDRGYAQQWFGKSDPEPEAPQPVPVPVAEDAPSASDEQFTAYMGQALDRIENRVPMPDAIAADPAPSGGEATLSIPVNPTSPDTVAQSLSRIANALERVSTTPVPLPDLPDTDATADAEADADDDADSDGDTTAERDEAPRAPVAAAPRVPSVPSVPSAATATPSKEPAEDSRETASTPAPANIYALVGTLERGEGDRPAALFELNGSPQWIDLGESIGGSGWTLVEVTGDRVSVRRNGEVRTIYVGQQF